MRSPGPCVVDLELGLQAIKGLPAEAYFIQYNPDCDLVDAIDRSYNTSGKTSTLGGVGAMRV
jgi:hypothetical protein